MTSPDRPAARRVLLAAILACLLPAAPARPAAPPVALTVHTDRVAGHVADGVYGHFLEHIYHSLNGSLWGEVVWNRSFEESLAVGQWRAADGCLVSPLAGAEEVRFPFGQGAWRACEFTVEVSRVEGTGTAFVGLRADRWGSLQLHLGAPGNRAMELLSTARERSGKIEAKSVAAADAQIESGKWYTVRARYDGQRYQAWVDGRPVFDVETPARPEGGQVVLGAINARVRFRNPHVRSLDGKPILSGLRGSVWLRGDAPQGLVVRLADGDRILAEQAIPSPGSEWKEFPVALTPTASAGHATLHVLAQGKASFWLDQISLMPDSARAAGGFRPDLLKAVADIRPASLRWPGGSFVGGFDWKGAVGPQHKRIGKNGWDEYEPMAFGVDEFLRLCQTLKSEPVMVVYTGPKNRPQDRARHVQDVLDLMDYCNGPATTRWGAARAANGHPEPYAIKRWELDNEIWSMKPDEYAQLIADFAPAMRKAHAGITLIACGSGQLGKTWGDGDAAVIDNASSLVDYLSPHHYESATRFAEGPADLDSFVQSLGKRRLSVTSADPCGGGFSRTRGARGGGSARSSSSRTPATGSVAARG